MAEQQFGRRRERDQAREQTAALVRRMSSLVVVDVDVDVASRACLPVLLPPLFGVSYNTSLDVNGMRCSKNMRGGRKGGREGGRGAKISTLPNARV